MPKEIEAKFRLADPQALRARLRRLDAQRLGCAFETNRIFDAPDGRLRRAGCGLRVREWRSLEPDSGGGATLTFKGPREASELKTREEVETPVDDAAAAITILQHLGFREVIVYEKRRETWRLGDCEVTIDELPRLGWYSEIEGPHPAAIAAARTRLELSDCPLVQEGYVHMAATHGEPDDYGRRRLRFEAGTTPP